MAGKAQNQTCNWIARAIVPDGSTFDTIFCNVKCMDIETDIGEAKGCICAVRTGVAVFPWPQKKEEGNEQEVKVALSFDDGAIKIQP
eukprot:8788864-Ditylum_brightwellii.AAC.1